DGGGGDRGGPQDAGEGPGGPDGLSRRRLPEARGVARGGCRVRIVRGVAAAVLVVGLGPWAAAPAPARPLPVGLRLAPGGGIPQAGCRRSCCTGGRRERVASLAIVDPASRRWWLIDATPDFPAQLAAMTTEAPACSLAGIFLTHAHIGHYTGLMHLGREVMGA